MESTDYPSRLAIWGAGFTTLALLCGAALLGHLNFSRWDAMETFLPAIWYAHSEILHGRFPLWNPLQNLGEPLHALGIGGALYPPYTIAVALARLADWPQARALDLIAIMHAAFGAVGMAKLLLELRVRPSLAFVAAVSAMLSGFALIVGAMWVHVLPNLAWSIWAMWGFRRVIAAEGTTRGLVVATISLGAVFLTGHIQMAANVWLAVGLWAIGLAAATGTLRKCIPSFALIAIGAALLALPAVLPTALILDDANRMATDVTAGRGFRLFAMLGLLLPSIRSSDGALVHSVLVTTFVGAWVVPGLVLGVGVFLHRRSDADALQLRAFAVTTAVAVICIWLNFGPSGGLYSVLHSLPVWSHFRVAYKYFERAVPMLAIAGALGLELAARWRPPRAYAFAAIPLAILAAAVWIDRPATEPLAALAGATALLTMLIIAVAPHLHGMRALVPLAVVQAIALIGITQAPTHSKPYSFDRKPSARLPLPATQQRVLPLSEGPIDHAYIRPLALFYTPTLDGYASASGHRFALTSLRLQSNFATSVSGAPMRNRIPLPTLLNSNFLKLANIGHLVVYIRDSVALSAVAQAFPNAAITNTPMARIVHIGSALPPAWFATTQGPGNPAGTYEVLFGPAPASSAVVDGDLRRRPLPPARVMELDWDRQRVEVGVNAPVGGLLVFSTSYSREWIATIDGTRTHVVPVNEIFAGVWVPDGSLRVVLAIRRWPLYVGLACALLGLIVCWLATRVRGRE